LLPSWPACAEQKPGQLLWPFALLPVLQDAFCAIAYTEHVEAAGPLALPWVEQLTDSPTFIALQLMRVPVSDPFVTLQLDGPGAPFIEPLGPAEQYAITPVVEQLGFNIGFLLGL